MHKQALVAARLACIFLLAAVFIPAAPSFAQPASPALEEAVSISDAQGLGLAAHLLEGGQTESAINVYWLLLQSGDAEISIEAAFQLSQIYMALGDNNKAIGFLVAILNRFPDLARVRLELALAYFLNENYDDARFHFELVKGGKDIPPEVVEQVDRFLKAIRTKKNWSLEVGLGYVPDSNLNQASGNTQECIDTNLGLFCRKLEDKKSGHGARLNVAGNYYLKLSKNFGIRNSVGVYLTEYGGKDYDDYIFYAASGPRVIFGNSEASVQPTYTRRVYGGKSYSESYGARFDMQNDFGRLLLASGASFRKNEYARDYMHSALKGQDYSAYVRPRFILSNQSFVEAGLDYMRDETADKAYGSDQWRYSLGWYYFFKYGVSLYVEGALTDAKYHEAKYYITQDHRIGRKKRRDSVKNLTVELGVNKWEAIGLRPALQYVYTRQDSNIWSHEYDRHRVNFLMTFRF